MPCSKVTAWKLTERAQAGRDIANYTRAASVWIAESPPSTPGNYGIADLQDCADPAGARFLPCAFTEDITIRYATNAAGEPVNFADLVIEATLPPEGPTGSIDFGVFRQGDDANDDGFPDPRPDLAAIALQHASEETPSGVFGYFSLQFAREDLAGLVTDPNDPSFDIAEVENVARIQATVGAHAAASPFLRVDGSNQMQSGITFVNGVQLNMSADRLEIDAPGGINFETDVRVENLSATDLTATTLETQTATVSDELQVIAPDGVTGVGFDRLDQSADIVRIDGDVVRLLQDIDLNKIGIDQNRQDITSNIADVLALQTDVQGNRNRIGTNAANIKDMGKQVDLLIDGTSTNMPDISVCAPLVGNREQSNGQPRGTVLTQIAAHAAREPVRKRPGHLRLPRTVQPQSSYIHASRRKYVELRNPHRQLLYRPILQNEHPRESLHMNSTWNCQPKN